MSKLIKFFLFAFLLLGSEISLSAQISLNSQESVSENSSVQMTDIDESSITLDAQAKNTGLNVSRGSSFFLVLRMIFVLAVVLAVIYGVLLLLKKSMTTEAGDDQFLRQVASINVAPGKSVQVVTLTDKHAFLIGVSDNSVNLISKIDDLELVQAMNLYSDTHKRTQKPRSFQDILDIFMPNGPRNEGVFTSSERNQSDFLERQRERLNGGE